MMFKAVLFDLDGTLLNVDMMVFLPQYFKIMAAMAGEKGYPDGRELIEQINLSTRKMIEDNDPNTTNEQVFNQDFYNHWPYSPQEFSRFFAYFYQEGFPLLSEYCLPFAGVRDMMAGVMAQGWKVVIATNPVFPRTAIEQRLEWAGLGEFRFDLLTSYEVMHFCKPNLNYYLEIADIIGTYPKDCLMVGNDVGEDIVAGRLGMKTFLAEDMLIDSGNGFMPDWRGTLQDLYTFFHYYKMK